MDGFRPCIVIPIYNHHHGIVNVIEQLRLYQLPCLIIDDGSTAPCKKILNALQARESFITLLSFDENRGKGIAVCAGLRYAQSLGFTHALQLDSDGQHTLADVPTFLNKAKIKQNAVITGKRAYRDMPVARRYGRGLTDIWVWVHTLSTEIKDSMCGFRLYPIKETMTLLNTTSVGSRMDFDTEILVKLYWEQVAIEQISTRVVYSDKIISHFNLLRDNVRITQMHTRLFFGMLRRLPVWLLERLRFGKNA
ncbi:MAG: glycosyltransferase family 2 protein [Gammaproteobacteria bacterium]|nr:glycosyltransferase family 2 protein [Gammaproteobacteria bacterium]